MSWRADLWQQLSHLRERMLNPACGILGTWPGLITVALLLLASVIGITFFTRASSGAAAQAPSPSALAQLAAPRTPTRTATASATDTQNVTGGATSTATSTRRSPTPTWTPFPTATQIAVSPLLAQTIAPTQVVPLPADGTVPQLAPAVTPKGGLAGRAGVPLLLRPTPTPTRTIIEALAQPVPSGGLAGMVATATAVAPLDEQPSTENPQEGLIAAEVEATESEAAEVETTETEGAEVAAQAETATAPAPTATPASMPTPDGIVRTARVPILMYHYISIPPANADIYRQDLSVAPDLLAAHLDTMQQAGYTTISLYTLLDHLTHGSPLPEKPVVLTFDDGYVDNYTNAFPMLRDRGLTATFFIVTDFIHDKRPEYLTWDMVHEMYTGGMSIEAHGRNHVSLANKDSDYLIWQALGSFESIEVEIGVRPHFISYPAGEYDQLTIDIFRSANYWAGFTTKQGATHSSDDLFQIRRIRVRGTTSPGELLRLLALEW